MTNFFFKTANGYLLAIIDLYAITAMDNNILIFICTSCYMFLFPYKLVKPDLQKNKT